MSWIRDKTNVEARHCGQAFWMPPPATTAVGTGAPLPAAAPGSCKSSRRSLRKRSGVRMCEPPTCTSHVPFCLITSCALRISE